MKSEVRASLGSRAVSALSRDCRPPVPSTIRGCIDHIDVELPGVAAWVRPPLSPPLLGVTDATGVGESVPDVQGYPSVDQAREGMYLLLEPRGGGTEDDLRGQ